jgi:CubicO group peptidase (beta-lactamase class C family)
MHGSAFANSDSRSLQRQDAAMLRRRLLDSSYLARYLLLNTVDITDHIYFPARRIENRHPTFRFVSADDGSLATTLDRQLPSQFGWRDQSLAAYLQRNATTAFLIIQGDRLLYARYFHGYQHDSFCTSFSMAKSFVSAMVGVALHEKLIASLDAPVARYLPELRREFWSAITVRHLLSMSSGLAYDEAGFFPWSDQPRIYYTLDLRRLAAGARRREAPGLRFHYNNYNLVLLGMILERVTGGPVSLYLQEKIWKPLGMETAATWSLDSRTSAMEKMESGLNAVPVDFAKFGRLYLRRGDWNGTQLIPESWVVESTTIGPDAMWTHYKYLWWIMHSGHGRFMAAGNLGQYLFVAPDKDLLILRFGRGKPRDWRTSYAGLFTAIADIL